MTTEPTLPISRLVLCAQTDNAYQWLQTPSFTTGLFVLICQHTDQPIKVLKGRKFILPDDNQFLSHENYYRHVWEEIDIIDCDPVLCGHLTIKTEIVAVRSADPQFNPVPVIAPKVESIQPVQVSDFLSKANDPRVALPRLLGSSLKLNVKGINDLPFKQVNVVMVHNHQAFSKDVSLGKHCIHDTDNTVVVGKRTAQELGVFHGSFIEIKAVTDIKPQGHTVSNHLTRVQSTDPQDKKTTVTNSSEKRTRVGQVCVVERQETELQKNSVFLNSCLWFNLTSGSLSLNDATGIRKFCSIRKFTPTSVEGLSCSQSWHGVPHFALELHISCVMSPEYSISTPYTEALQQYFKTTRLVQTGDVLCVRTAEVPGFHQDASEGRSNRCPVLFFKVIKILPKIKGRSTFLADANRTTLLQEGSVNTHVPTAITIPITARQMYSGLEEHVEKLLKLVKPHITSRNQCDELYPSVLLTGLSGSGKTLVTQYTASALNLHLLKINCHELCGETSAAIESRIKHAFQKAVMYAPCLLLLQYIHALGRDRDGHSEDPRVAGALCEHIRNLPGNNPKWPVVVIATCNSPQQLTSDMQEGFFHHIEIGVPSEALRIKTLDALLETDVCASDVSIKHIAQRTAGMAFGDLYALTTRARANAYKRLSALCGHGRLTVAEEMRLCEAGVKLKQVDFVTALNTMQASHSDAIGAPKIPNVKWEDVGGLVEVKGAILDTIQLPLQHPELMAAGLRRSGVLLYGPPGTGKTLLAKAVATECSLNFLSVKGPELLNMYVGQSEENVREVFTKARSATPCVVFFDELDSLAPNRGRSGDSGGVMDRVVSQLLAELDGLNKSADVFIIGATNRPDLIDPALLRPGRFDKLLYLGVSEDKDAQLKILKALTRKFHMAEGSCLENVVQRCPPNLTGADFYALCSDAMLEALKQRIDELDSAGGEKQEQVDLKYKMEVTEEHFYKAISALVPSVSISELDHYKSLQHSFMAPK